MDLYFQKAENTILGSFLPEIGFKFSEMFIELPLQEFRYQDLFAH